MGKLVVTCKTIQNHYHDGDILFSCQGHSAFDLDIIMYKLFDFYNPDEYDDYFTFIYNGEKVKYWDLFE